MSWSCRSKQPDIQSACAKLRWIELAAITGVHAGHEITIRHRTT